MDDNSKLNITNNELDMESKGFNSVNSNEKNASNPLDLSTKDIDQRSDSIHYKKLKIEIPDITLSLDDLEKKVNDIFDDSNLSILEKSKKLTEFKKYVKQEQDKINFMIDKVSEISPKKSKKFKSLSLDDLVTLFEQEEDINSKIKIYQNICYSINKFKSKIFDIDETDE